MNQETKWGAYTRAQGAKYYIKLGIKCCDEETFVNWFVNAERANSRCRTVNAFCSDCTTCYAKEMREANKCINVTFKDFNENIVAKSE